MKLTNAHTLGALLALAGSLPLTALPPEKIEPDQLAFFEKKIRPVLVEQCYKCHSAQAEKLKGGLFLDTKQGLLTGGSSGPAIVPGRPEKSLLIKFIKSEKDDEMMPPKGDRLSAEVVGDFERWVRMGAPDPRVAAGGALAALRVDKEKAKQHWAYQRVVQPPVPAVKDASRWARTELDKHVLAKLEAKGLTPSPIADKRTLIRRATFDLIGLPPTAQELTDFVADKSPKAFEKVLDRLLASPHYGERWGRHWLDVARFAETSGDRNINARAPANFPYAWTYRDYVIKAFNADKPYDQFIVEQLAADRLELGEDRWPLAALGFLTVGKRFMGNANELIDDRIDVVTQGLMGMTAACARCHDHKFDPVSQKDYYALHGVFSSSVEPDEQLLVAKRGTAAEFEDFQRKVEEIETRMKGVREIEESKVLTAFRQVVDKYLLAAAEVVRSGQGLAEARQAVAATKLVRERGLDPDIFGHWMTYLKGLAKSPDPVFAPWFEFAALAENEFAARAKSVTARIRADKTVNPLVAAAFATAPDSLPAVAEIYGTLFKDTDKLAQPGKAPEGARGQLHAVLQGKASPIKLDNRGFQRVIGVRIRNAEALERAKIDDLRRTHAGSPVRAMALVDKPRAVNSFVQIRGEPNNRGPVVPRRFLEILAGENPAEFKDGSGRLELAREVASKDNPLTARVFMNRLWNWHFGDAIVATPGDFGLRSEPPSNQELLDYLAAQFMDQGWSVKKMHKLVMLSSVWQQVTASNPRNVQLDPGNSLFWRQNLQRLDFESMRDTLLALGGKHEFDQMGGPSVDLSTGEGRRTVYGYLDRARIPETYRIFDFANPDMTSPQRELTTVPLQALFLMNNSFVIEQARNVVSRPEMLSGARDEEKVAYLYQLLFQRKPSTAEATIAREYLADQKDKPATGGADVNAWRYGYGEYDAAGKRLLNFTPLPAFIRDSWVLVDPNEARRIAASGAREAKGKLAAMNVTAFAISLNAVGGVPGDARQSVVRRWVAPRDGTLSIEGTLAHAAKTGDGVQAFVHAANSGGQLGAWAVAGSETETNLRGIQVKRGDPIDFVVTSRGTSEDDAFKWVPVLHMAGSKRGEEYVWHSQQEFSGPVRERVQGQPFTPWERLAQAMLMSNELIYVN